jgi:hypothetical protein
MWDKLVDDPLFCEVSRGITILTPSVISIVRSCFPLSTSSALPRLPRLIPC